MIGKPRTIWTGLAGGTIILEIVVAKYVMVDFTSSSSTFPGASDLRYLVERPTEAERCQLILTSNGREFDQNPDLWVQLGQNIIIRFVRETINLLVDFVYQSRNIHYIEAQPLRHKTSGRPAYLWIYSLNSSGRDQMLVCEQQS